ncbi:MAG: tripartite tricarboxylate transporter substrate binding protein [Polaromonas sp.]|uniref:Bug family tripartite tricarboxylate transporter substrate binding protein n=1 Tax=Polaromonas sp. TaxID=1869339 RepID=UPI002716288F|nr:tripartite tricarboxylate transporter substrate binding protein [Polaromonas sp.]MDO9113148.1 tripartite tricarboxylate transporter substrate binding protein [Polaromonas sp.]MDP1887927.1 tripartite tricarboxylate transporter substrate binding protein [Polaromonas sp.]
MKRIMRTLLALTAGVTVLAGAGQAQTPDYPNKPIRIVVTFPPGGSTDVVVRMLVPRLNEKLGQQVVVDNRPGAGGNIGLTAVARAPADGYTLGVGAAGGLSANVSLYAQMPFDPVKDFRPVTMLAAIPFVLIGHPSVAAKNQRELIALAKATPGKLSIGHGGNGTAMHLSAQLFGQMSGTQFVEVPYRGSGPAALDVLAGQIPLAVVDLPSALQHIKAGKLVAYAVTSPQRLPMLPDVPTVSEGGLTGYDSTGWFGVVAPAGTPAPVIARLNAEITAALNDNEIKASMRNLGVEPAPGTAAEFEAYIKSETVKWARVIKTSGTKID